MLRRINRNTATNFALLATGSLLPFLCASLKNGEFLIPLNQYYISIVLASFVDSIQLLQIEYIYSTACHEKQKNLTERILGRQLGFAILCIPFIAVEFIFFTSSYIALTLNKHVFNVGRVGMVYGGDTDLLGSKLNLIGVLRNLAMSLSAILIDTVEVFVFGMVFIAIAETFIVLLLISKAYTVKIKPSIIRIGEATRVLRKSIRSIRTYGFAATALTGLSDRVFICVFDPLVQIAFFKYKVVQQYIDGFFGIFAYDLHLKQMKTKILPNRGKLSMILILMCIFGFTASIVLLKINNTYSAVIVLILCGAMSSRRILDGVLSANLRSIKQYAIPIYKSLIEVLCVFFGFVVSYLYFNQSADKIFTIYIFATIIPIVYLLNCFRVNQFGRAYL